MAKFLAAIVTIFALVLSYSLAHAVDHVEVVSENGAWNLKVNGQPYFVKGVAYTPTKRGEDPNNATRRDWMITDDNGNMKIDSPYDAYLDANKNNIQDANEPTVGDFQLMKEMGVNTIRVYHHASNAPEVQAGYGSAAALLEYNHPPNKDLLRDLYNTYGIRAAMGDLLGAYTIGSGAVFAQGTDYLNATQKARMKASVERMVLDFKDEPFLLMYILGNENNYSFTQTNAGTQQVAYAQFVEEITQMIHTMDPNHPVVLCMGDISFNLATLNTHAPSVDIYGANAYRQGAFGNIWTQVKSLYNKPVLLTEYGDYQNPLPFDEQRQSNIHQTSWLDIVAHKTGTTMNAIGGMAFTWLDDWWQNGLPTAHNAGVQNANLEWQGIMAQGTGPTSTSPYERQKRLVYDTYQSLWVEQTPVLAGDFTGDCAVDGADFLLWQRSLGATGENPADGNNDGIVNSADLDIWKANNGQTCTPAEVVAQASRLLAGDYNGDCSVDGADFMLWQRTLGQSVPYFSGADGDGSGKIDSGDLALWKTHSGRTCNSPSFCRIQFEKTSVTVPEVSGPNRVTMLRTGPAYGRVCAGLVVNPTGVTNPAGTADFYHTYTNRCWENGDSSPKTYDLYTNDDLWPEADETIALEMYISEGSCDAAPAPMNIIIKNDDFPALPGDFDRNCQVDGSDFTLWQRTLGSTVVPFTHADGNGNGKIDAEDLTVWKGQTGKVCDVPQPACQVRFQQNQYSIQENDIFQPLTLQRTGYGEDRVCVNVRSTQNDPNAATPNSDYAPLIWGDCWEHQDVGNREFSLHVMEDLMPEANEIVPLEITLTQGNCEIENSKLVIMNDDAPTGSALIGGTESSDVHVTKAKFYPQHGEKAELEFALAQPAEVRIALFDRRGYEVAILFNASLPRGHHKVDWNGHDSSGKIAASGVYTGVFTKNSAATKFKLILVN